MTIIDKARAWVRGLFGLAPKKKGDRQKAKVDSLLSEVGELGERIWKWLEAPDKVTEHLSLDVRMAQAGAEAAAMNQHDDAIPYAKLHLLDQYTTRIVRIRNWHARQVARAKAIFGKLQVEPYRGEPRVVSLRSRLQFSELGVVQNLKTKFAELSESENEFTLFRYMHHLGRAPQMPANPIFWFWILLLIALAEGTLNALALAFAGGFEGLLNAAVGGYLVSLATVALGVITGFVGLRYLGYRVREQPYVQRFWRIGGVFISVGALTLFVVMVIYMTVARLAEIRSMPGIISGDFQPIVSPTVFAITFIGLSLFTYFFSVLKAYEEFADPFPGYGRAYKRRLRAREAYEKQKREFLKRIGEDHAKALAELLEDLEGQGDQVIEIRALAGELEATDTSLKAVPTALWQSVEAMFQAYDEGFAAVVSNRRQGTHSPERPDDPNFETLPETASLIEQAQRQHHQNCEVHKATFEQFSKDLTVRLKSLLEQVENWETDFRNRHRPYGSYPEVTVEQRFGSDT